MYGEKKHEGKLSHELIAGAASFEAMKAWENHQRKEGMFISIYVIQVTFGRSRD